MTIVSPETGEQAPLPDQIARPNPYLDQVNFVSKDDPLDALLIDYQKQIEKDLTPTPAQQRELVMAVRRGDEDALKTLVVMNKGLIAAVGYPYRAQSFSNFEALMNVGETALAEAALSYDFRNPTTNFTNFAVTIMDTVFSKAFEWGRGTTYLDAENQPMLSVYRFMTTLKKASSLDDRNEKQIQDKERLQKEILLSHADWLQYLNLPNDEVESKMGIDISTFYKKMRAIQARLSIPNRSTLALACLDVGISFAVPELPENHDLTIHEREIASLLHLDYETAATSLGISFNAINNAANGIKAKLHARSRTEAVLMTRIYHLEPELDNTPEYLKPFSLFEREVLPYLALYDTEKIMEATGLSQYSVTDAISRMTVRTNTKNRRQLVLYLFDKGFEFDIPKPTKPLSELIKSDRLTLFQNLHLSDEELAEISKSVGLNPNSIYYNIAEGMEKTGARSRVELQLMALKYADEQFKTPETMTKQERLAEKLGLAALNRDYVEQFIDTLGNREASLIRAYYFSTEDVSWRAVAKQLGLDRTLSMVTARNGVLRLKRRMDAHVHEAT